MTDSERSSSSSEGSEAEQGHPLDEVLNRRAAGNSGPGSNPASKQQHANDSRRLGRSSLSGKKRSLEDGGVPAPASKPRMAAAAARSREPSQSPESGEVPTEGVPAGDLDQELIDLTNHSNSDASDSGYSSGSGTSSSGEEEEDMITNARRDLPAPFGVIIVQEGEVAQQNAEVRRLLRMPRYFDPDYEEAGRRCFKCGCKGHMARDCTNPQAKERPCYLCAGLGHEGRECPNSLCFKCSRPGHIARDCPYGYKASSWEDGGVPMCLRCGREDCPCAGQRDYVRAEGGCRSDYSRSDLQHVRCADCGRRGHLSCKPAPTQAAKLSCHNCGEGGHTAEECWKDAPNLVSRERAGGSRPSFASQQRASSSGYLGGYSSGGASRSQRQYSNQQQRQYSSYSQQQDGGGYGGGGGRYGGKQQYSVGQHPKFASYHYASEAAGQGRQSGGGQRKQDRRGEDYSYGYGSYRGSQYGGQR